MKRIIVPITKVDATQRMVYGVAAIGDVVDKMGEVFDYETSKPHFQEWSKGINEASQGKSFGNIRAMHNKVAAGFLPGALGFDDDSKSIEVGAKVVDDNEWEKVELGVYTGFSMGGKYVKQWTDDGGLKRYTAAPVEISLVDNPCIPGANFQMIKMDGAVEDRPFYIKENSNVLITNDQIAARAGELAKGVEGKTFADFIEDARKQLEKEAGVHGEAEGDATQPHGQSDASHGGTTHPGNDPKTKKKEGGESPRAQGDGSGGEQQEHGSDEGDASQDGGDPKQSNEEQDGAKSADIRDLLKQVWVTPDGKEFKKKADALAHITGKAATPSEELEAALDRLRGVVNKDATSPDNGNADTPEKDAEADDKKKPFAGAAPKFKKKKSDKAADADGLRKGLGMVARLVCIIEDLSWLQQSSMMEADYEKDNSTVPAQLKEQLVSLITILKAMVDEETTEMFSVEEQAMFAAALELAAPSDLHKIIKYVDGNEELSKTAGFAAVQKAGARHSAADLEKIQAVHDHSCALGAKCDGDDSEKHADGELNKAASDRINDLEKTNTALTDVVTKATAAITDLAAQMEVLKATPAAQPPARLQVVDKGADSPEYRREANEYLRNADPGLLAAAAIKLVQGAGGTPFRFGRQPE